MLRLAVGHLPHASVLTEEIDQAAMTARPEPSYTVDTLEALRARLGPGTGLRLLIGSDQAKLFDRWRAYDRVIELAEPLVMLRPPLTRTALLEALPPGFDRAQWAGRLVDVPSIAVSSSDIRDRVAAGRTIRHLVPRGVEQYILRKGLYGSRIDGATIGP